MNLTTEVTRYFSSNGEGFHPLWLGILILFGVITIIGLVCGIRIQCRSTLQNFINRSSKRNSARTETNSREDHHATLTYSLAWPPAASLPKRQSPKLYTLIRTIQSTNLERQTSLQAHKSISDADEHSLNESHPSQVQPTLNQLENIQTSEIARKFFASMRDTNFDKRSSSIGSFDSDVSLSSQSSSGTVNPSTNSRRLSSRSFYTPGFFQLTPSNV